MNPYCRAALFLLRLTAIGLMVISLMLLSRYVLGWIARRPVESSVIIIVLQTLPLAGGLLLLIKSSAIAHRLTDDFSETQEKTLEELLDSDDEP